MLVSPEPLCSGGKDVPSPSKGAPFTGTFTSCVPRALPAPADECKPIDVPRGISGGPARGPPPHPHPASLVTNSHPGVVHLPQVVNHADTTRLIEAPVVQAPLFVPPVLAQEPSRRTAWSPVVLPPRAPRSWAGRFLRLCWFRHFLTPSI